MCSLLLPSAGSHDAGCCRETAHSFPRLQVEATLSQGLLRVVASALGGIIGFLLLLRVHLANSPYFQVVLMLACTFAFGLLGPTALFIEAVVVLNSIGGTVFCEYK